MRTSSVSFQYINRHQLRFESKFYLNEHSFNSMQVEKNAMQCFALSDVADVFNPSIFKRQFCKSTPRSVQYFQSSDVPNASEFSSTFVSRQQAESLNLLVKKDDILITGFGSIGNTRLVSKFQNGVCYANNVCRVRVKSTARLGYIYAFLSSKYGFSQLNKNASGSVVRYIEAPGIKKTLIPDFPADFQQEVNDMIQESARLREKATDALNEAIRLVEDFCNKPFRKTSGKTFSGKNIADIRDSFNMRFDAPVYINDGVRWLSEINKPTKRLGDCQIKTWYPGIFKRVYVKKGLPYIKGSALFLNNPFKSCDELSKTKTPQLEELWLKERMLLISCAGACGDVKLITKEYEDKQAIGSPDIIRLTSTDSLFTTEYIFAYLQIPAIYDYMQSLKYGSVIERFDKYNVENIPIVEPSKEVSEKVTQIIRQYMQYTYRAFNLEETAIAKVEQEIEKWNK